MTAAAMARAAAPTDPRTARKTRKDQMTEKNKQSAALATAETEPAPGPFPSASFYDEIVAPVMAALEQFSVAIPPLDNLAVTQDFIKRKRRVPAPFVTHAVSAILVELELQNVKSLNTAQAFDDKRCLDALVPLARQMDAALKALLLIIQGREARLAANAQQIYAVAKAFARDREATSLGVHVVNMKRALKGPRRRRIVGGDTPETPGKEDSTNTSSNRK
jgi:hypothetical protein